MFSRFEKGEITTQVLAELNSKTEVPVGPNRKRG